MSMKDLLRFVHLAGSERSTAKVFAELSRYIGETLVAHRVTVFAVEQGRFVPLVSEYSSGTTDQPQFTRWRGSDTFEGSVLATRLHAGEDVLLIKDPTDVLPRRSVDAYEMKSLLVARLHVESEMLGALLIEGEHADLEGRLAEVRELAGIVALALANAKAFEREQDRAEESEVLLEVAAVLTESTEVRSVLVAVARNSAKVTGFERCSILLSEDDGSLTPVMSQFADGHTDDEMWDRFRSIEADLPAARLVIESGVPAAYDMPETTPDLIPPEWHTPFNFNSVLFVPLMVRGQGLGVLLLDRRERGEIAPRQIRIALAVAAQGAAAIGMSRLLQRESNSRQEAETALRSLKVRECQQAATAALSQSAIAAVGLDDLMDEAARILTKTLDVEYGKILELLPGGEQFLLKAGVGWDTGLVGEATVNAGLGSQAGFTISALDPVIVDDLATDQRFSGPRLLTDHGIVSGISVVIEGRDDPYGVLGIHTSRQRTFTPEDVDFLQSIANILAGAIERRRGEQAVLEGERRLQAILDNASDAIISTEGDRIIVFNRQASKVFGYTSEEALGMPVRMLVPEHFRHRYRNTIAAFEGGKMARRLMGRRLELIGRRKNGEEFPAEITISRVEVGGQRVLTSIVRDITERIEAYRRIEDSEKRFRDLFERSPIAMWEEDFSAVESLLDGLREDGIEDLRSHLRAHPDVLDGAIDLIRIRNVNSAAVRLIEADNVEQLLGGFRPEIRTGPVREAFMHQLVAIWEGRESLQFDFVATTYRGARIDCVLHFAAGRSNDRLDLSHVIVALADITERKAAEEQLRQLAQSKDDLIASVSHEIRTPLTAILGFGELLRDEPGDLSEAESAEMLEALLAQTADVADIVEDLLVSAKADIGKLHVVQVPVDLLAQASQVLETWGREVVARIHVSGPSVHCLADPARVRQIIRNIISNALRYGGDNVRIAVGCRHATGYISVVDDGPGVPEEDSERIFKKYQRGDQLPGLTHALGLGLALSRHLARLMDGDVTYRRDEDESLFELTLPLA
jgi:PAS domain S-box-containing protein